MACLLDCLASALLQGIYDGVGHHVSAAQPSALTLEKNMKASKDFPLLLLHAHVIAAAEKLSEQ